MTSTSKPFNVCHPTRIRIIGYGDDTYNLVESIKSLGYNSLDCTTISSSSEITSSHDDKIIIVLVNDSRTGIENLLRSFRYSGRALIIGIVTHRPLLSDDCVDSQAVVSIDRIISTVNNVANIILNTDGYTTIGVFDVEVTLRNSSHFIPLDITGTGADRIQNAIDKADIALSPMDYDTADKIIISLYFNRNSIRPLVIKEVLSMQKALINRFPNVTHMTWGMYNDETITDDSIRMSLILAGKNIAL